MDVNEVTKDGISVIVPTYNRAELLRKTLRSLWFQVNESPLFEVIVVDDGSSDHTISVVEEFQGGLDIRYFFQNDEGYRVARARNIGIKNAKFRICLFLDSGVVANVNLVSEHYMAHGVSKSIIAIGYAYGFEERASANTRWLPNFGSVETLNGIFRMLEANPNYQDCRQVLLDRYGLGMKFITTPWALCWTCHLSCSTQFLREVDGFDEWFSSWGGEDIELALRLYKLGATFRELPCYAIHWFHERDEVQNARSMAENALYIYQKHPSKVTYEMAHSNLTCLDIVRASIMEALD